MKSYLILVTTLLATASCAQPTGLTADGDPIPLAEYTIQNGTIQGNVDPDHLDQWVRFRELIPKKYYPEIVRFLPIDSVAADGIDGSVAPVDDGRTQWSLMLDTTGEVPLKELDRTMVHEFAHLLTLRLAQVPNQGSYCHSTLSISEGCPIEGSYLDAFTDAFHPNFREGEEELDYSADKFVTDYAATNVVEDVAESFAEWVVHPERWQNGNNVAAQKVAFFNAYPELVTLKAEIRENL